MKFNDNQKAQIFEGLCAALEALSLEWSTVEGWTPDLKIVCNGHLLRVTEEREVFIDGFKVQRTWKGRSVAKDIADHALGFFVRAGKGPVSDVTNSEESQERVAPKAPVGKKAGAPPPATVPAMNLFVQRKNGRRR